MDTILYIDDEEENLFTFKMALKSDFHVLTTQSTREGLNFLNQIEVKTILVDQRMPEVSGVEFFASIKEDFPDIPRILVTGYADYTSIVEAINTGRISYYVSKPWKKEGLVIMIKNAIQTYNLKKENKELISKLKESNDFLQDANQRIEVYKQKLEKENLYLKDAAISDKLIDFSLFVSNEFRNVEKKMSQVAPTEATVLITGETGTGKELVATTIHQMSKRSSHPIIKINCSALPLQLIESELFGYEKGAFTGAFVNKEGLFEIANGGTLFLDEIGELPLEVQPKLLRVLQEGEFYRLGSPKISKTDVRIIAATNRDLDKEVREGRFRADLLYRLNIFPIQIPALRQRIEDIESLAQVIISKLAKKFGRKVERVSENSLKRLKGYQWPGNVRELENVIERAMIVSDGNGPLEIHSGLLNYYQVEFEDGQESGLNSLEMTERNSIIDALKKTNGKVSGRGSAAELLQINPNTLRSKMTRYKIR